MDVLCFLNSTNGTKSRKLSHMFIPACIYLFKVKNGNIGTVCKVYSNLRTKTPERFRGLRSDVSLVNFEHIPNSGWNESINDFLVDTERHCVQVKHVIHTSQLTFTCSKSTIEILEKGVEYVSVFKFEHISHIFLVFLLLTLNK